MIAKTKTYPLKLCVSAMMVAAEIVLNRFCSINTAGWKIGFSFVPVVLTAMLYGSGMAALVGGLSDLCGALLFPIGPYHPGFTIVAALAGWNYGFFLHNTDVHRSFVFGEIHFTTQWKKTGFWHMLLPTLWNQLVLGLALNTVWVSMLYGSRTYWGWFLYRLPEYAVMIPVIMLLMPALMRIASTVRAHMT